MCWRAVNCGLLLSLLLASSMLGQNPASLLISGSSAAVTKNQLQAPRKAREALRQAQQAIRSRNLTEARKQLAHALTAYPNYGLALTARGILSVVSEDRKSGTSDLRKAIEVDPSYGPPYVVLASLGNDERQYDAALILAEKGTQLAPWAWQSHVEIARALFGKGGDHPRALQELDMAGRLPSGGTAPQVRSYIHYLKGSMLRTNNPAAAKIEFEQAVQEEPGGRFAIEATRAIEELGGSDNPGQ